MASGLQTFEIPLFDGKTNFTLWQSTIQDLLVQQGLDQALEEEKPVSMSEREWSRLQKKAVSTNRLALAPEIKFGVLKETTPKALWEKLESIYASKSLTNRLCLKMELYSLKMEEGGNLHDHINSFNQLVCQLSNADDNIKEEEQALLLLASLPRSYKPLVQTLLVGRKTLTKDEVTTALRESERMMKNDATNTGEDRILVSEKRERGRSQSRGHGDHRWRSGSRPREDESDVELEHGDPRWRSQSRPRRDLSDVKCYYCGEKGHMQVRCPRFREDVKMLRDMSLRKNDGGSNTNVVSDVGDDEVYLATSEEVAKSEWVMDSAASMHICRDQAMFDTLKTDGEFGHFNLASGEKLKVEGTGSVRMRLRNGASHTLHNVRYVPTSKTNVISLGAMTSEGCRFVGKRSWCKVLKGRRLIMEGRKNEKNICFLEGRVVQRRYHDAKMKQ